MKKLICLLLLILLSTTVYGVSCNKIDYNHDGVHDMADVEILVSHYSCEGDELYKGRYDLNKDGCIDHGDFFELTMIYFECKGGKRQ